MDDNDARTAIAVFIICNIYFIWHVGYLCRIIWGNEMMQYRAGFNRYKFSEHLIFALLVSGLSYTAFYFAYENMPEATDFYRATINWSLVTQLAAYWIVFQLFVVSGLLCFGVWVVFLSDLFDSIARTDWFFGLTSIGITVLSIALFFLLTYFWNAYPDAF